MVKRAITEAKLDELLGRVLKEGLRLVAPTSRAGRLVYAPVTAIDQVERGHINTDLPAKEFLFPKTEAVLEYETARPQPEVRPVEPAVEETVLFGLRPCDAAGVAILEQVFGWDYRDDFFFKRRGATTLVTVSCSDAAPWCFCTAVGYGPTSSFGSDVLLTEVEDARYLAEAPTKKGERFLERYAELFEDAGSLDKEAATRAAEAKIARSQDLTGAPGALKGTFNDERWRPIGQACLSCGSCAASCPTCHCFDILDEADLIGGKRLKLWDTCQTKVFTLHASGHNPRGTQPSRYRQRVMHKFSYFPERFGRIMCVGCGRCLINCPVGQDIYEAALTMMAPGAAV